MKLTLSPVTNLAQAEILCLGMLRMEKSGGNPSLICHFENHSSSSPCYFVPKVQYYYNNFRIFKHKIFRPFLDLVYQPMRSHAERNEVSAFCP
jgi:hypothetical protein